jgi:hypothetical protein
MSAATLHTAPDAGNYAVSSDRESSDRPEGSAATGPQRSLEASSFISLSAGVAPMDAAFDALPTPSILSYRDGSNLCINARAR